MSDKNRTDYLLWCTEIPKRTALVHRTWYPNIMTAFPSETIRRVESSTCPPKKPHHHQLDYGRAVMTLWPNIPWPIADMCPLRRKGQKIRITRILVKCVNNEYNLLPGLVRNPAFNGRQCKVIPQYENTPSA